MTFPDFIGIGAQKAGTTWLYHNLRKHPQIWMPRKELHYFDHRFGDDASFSLRSRIFGNEPEDQRWRSQVRHWTSVHLRNFSLSGLLWVYKYYMRPPSDDWYASLFEPRKRRIAGEITPNYSVLDRDVIAHVHEIMPEARIIFMVRSPIERAWSQAVMYFDKIKGQSIEEVSEEQFRKFSDNQSSLLTDYRRTLENWGSFYPREQIFVGFLEDVHFYPNRLLKRLYRFLGVETDIDYKVIRRKIHSRDVQTMPTKLAVYLARVYREDLGLLSERFGGYASFWRYCAERLIEEPPEEEQIPYPLWESPLWEEWVAALGEEPAPGTRQAEVRSGPLPQVWSVGW
jgi:sulfotransferase family protein